MSDPEQGLGRPLVSREKGVLWVVTRKRGFVKRGSHLRNYGHRFVCCILPDHDAHLLYETYLLHQVTQHMSHESLKIRVCVYSACDSLFGQSSFMVLW